MLVPQSPMQLWTKRSSRRFNETVSTAAVNCRKGHVFVCVHWHKYTNHYTLHDLETKIFNLDVYYVQRVDYKEVSVYICQCGNEEHKVLWMENHILTLVLTDNYALWKFVSRKQLIKLKLCHKSGFNNLQTFLIFSLLSLVFILS